MASVVVFALNFSFYLGISILVVMVSAGLYYCCKYCCCCHSCSISNPRPQPSLFYCRRQRQFSGIRSHPSFVEAITVAFQSSADSLQGLLRSGEEGEWRPALLLSFSPSASEEAREKIQLNCTTCSLIRQGSYMISGAECGAALL